MSFLIYFITNKLELLPKYILFIFLTIITYYSAPILLKEDKIVSKGSIVKCYVDTIKYDTNYDIVYTADVEMYDTGSDRYRIRKTQYNKGSIFQFRKIMSK